MKKNYESPKMEMILMEACSFLELSGGVGGTTGDLYAFDRFNTDYGSSF